MPLPKEESLCTEQDYWNLPEGRRAELIDGVLYDMAPPSRVHQDISGGFVQAFRNHIDMHGGLCKVYAAPFAVDLNADRRTWLEPDMVLVCDPSKLTERGCKGAPDLVVEIALPSSMRMDYITKLGRYERAGVREYWIVDPAKQMTVVYMFDPCSKSVIQMYPFATEVPVGVYGGELKITVEKFLQ